MEPENIKEAENLLALVSELKEKLGYAFCLKRKGEIEKIMNRPGFWDNSEAAQKVVDELKEMNGCVEPFRAVDAVAGNISAAIELAEEDPDAADALGEEFAQDIKKIRSMLADLEFRLSLSGKHDKDDAFLMLNSGAGGIDACDWTEMLLRMYMRFLEQQKLNVRLLDLQREDEGGIKGATLEVRGAYAYGYLKGEVGVHRLVRISPFNFAGKRQTSFASVDVTPIVKDDIDIEIKDVDLRIDFFRASGAGGQHVNVTDSAVRITHLPTGTVVSCQNERSQHANRRVALRILKSRLYRMEEEKRAAKRAKEYGAKMTTSFGSQIRNYVLHPYRLVKDVRTGEETGNVDAVLDGDLMPFVKAYLHYTIGRKD